MKALLDLSFITFLVASCIGESQLAQPASPAPVQVRPAQATLGQFSVSLAVKDLRASRVFYESLGFVAEDYRGPMPKYGDSWLILRHGDAVIGLFQGRFDKNILTFNPTDVRAVQRAAKSRGIAFALEADDGTGPAAAMAIDPDGNPVLIDQH